MQSVAARRLHFGEVFTVLNSAETAQIGTDSKKSGQIQFTGDSALVTKGFSGVVKTAHTDYEKCFEVAIIPPLITLRNQRAIRQ